MDLFKKICCHLYLYLTKVQYSIYILIFRFNLYPNYLDYNFIYYKQLPITIF